MFNSTNSIPMTMPVTPAGSNGGMFGGDCYGGGWFWWIIILIILFGGWGGYGFGNNGQTSSVYEGYVLNNDFSEISRQLDSATDRLATQGNSIANGLCDGFYTQAQLINGVTQSIADSNYGIQNAITQSRIADMQDSFGLQSAINGVNVNNNTNTQAITSQITALGTQMASCCCDQKYQNATQFADLNYRLAEQSCQTRQAIADSTAAIVTNQDANTRAILDFMTQDKIATLTAENASLKAAANNAAQTYDIVNSLRTPTPIPSYTVPNPYASYGCGCGCNCGA